MRTHLKGSQLREQEPGCSSSCCRQACNHSLSSDSPRPGPSPVSARRFPARPVQTSTGALPFFFCSFFYILGMFEVTGYERICFVWGVKRVTRETLMHHNPQGQTEAEVEFLFHLKCEDETHHCCFSIYTYAWKPFISLAPMLNRVMFNMHTVSCLWRLLEVSTFHSLLVGFKVNVMCAKCFIQVKLHKVYSAKGSICVFLNSHHPLQSFVICLVNTKPKVM